MASVIRIDDHGNAMDVYLEEDVQDGWTVVRDGIAEALEMIAPRWNGAGWEEAASDEEVTEREKERKRSLAEHVAEVERAALRENLLLLAATGSMTDEELFRYEEAMQRWTVGARYLHGQVLLYEVDMNLYKCQQNLDARAEHPPGSAGTEALYALVQRPVEPGGVLPWVYGEEVHPGDRRAFDGVAYERITAWNPGTNIWEPWAAPTVWKKVEG